VQHDSGTPGFWQETTAAVGIPGAALRQPGCTKFLRKIKSYHRGAENAEKSTSHPRG
jgi:hypothetical protein